jgi:Insertion element 4 transposase N-terminal
VAQGSFARGHLGELTQAVPFDIVDEALAETRAVQSRVRSLPSRVVVYLLLAGCLFPELGYPGVWRKLTAYLDSLDPAMPTAGALCQARRPRRGTTEVAVRAVTRPGTHAGPLARTARLRDRRHDVHHRGQPGEPGHLHQTPMQQRRLRLPTDPASGLARLRHPHPHRRRVRPHRHGRDRLRATTGPRPASRNGRAARPRPPRLRPDHSLRHARRRGPRALHPPPRLPGPGPLSGRLLPVHAGTHTSPRDRRRSPSSRAPAAAQASTDWSPLCSTTTATRPPSWSPSITSAGRSKPPTWR